MLALLNHNIGFQTPSRTNIPEHHHQLNTTSSKGRSNKEKADSRSNLLVRISSGEEAKEDLAL